MVELIINDTRIEGVSDDIKYTAQISDMFDIGNVTTSHTNSFSFPKTPNNTKAMKQLGIVGDTSSVPYEKVSADLNHFGFPLIRKGWFQSKPTDERYNGAILSGSADFFKAIENKTMGADLDLSNFNHEKTLPVVINSWTNDYYRYLIADYNGKNIVGSSINIDYQVPSFNMGKLLDLVMFTFGFSYDIANIEDINSWWITYPKDPASDVVEVAAALLTKNPFIATPVNVGGGQYSAPLAYNWDDAQVNEGSLVANWKYVVPSDGGYRIESKTEMYAFYKDSRTGSNSEQYAPVLVAVMLNGTTIMAYNSDPYSEVVQERTLYLSAGDIIEYRFVRSPYVIDSFWRLLEFRSNGIELNIYKTSQGSVSLSNSFKDFSIKDFIKEILWATATIPIIDQFSNRIKFVPMSNRTDFSKAKNWSSKYVRRVKESYATGSYAQKNIFAHKYNDPDDISQNGYLNIENRNLPDEKILVQSKIYAPELTNFIFPGGATTKKFRIWDAETKENSEGEIEISYKGLSGRYFIVKEALSNEGLFGFVSEAVEDSDTVTKFPYAISDGVTFDQVVPAKYSEYLGVLNNMRIHDIELALSIEDYLSLDLTIPYFFEKENMYYILNRVSFSDGETVVGEFLRINKVLL